MSVELLISAEEAQNKLIQMDLGILTGFEIRTIHLHMKLIISGSKKGETRARHEACTVRHRRTPGVGQKRGTLPRPLA